MQGITVLGATGSIGLSTLDVIGRHPDRYEVFALTAHSRIDELAALCDRFNPRYAVVRCPDDIARLQARLTTRATEVLAGQDALEAVASHSDCDTVMAAIVGAAGLLPTLAAVRAGKRVLLANKEALVMAGALFMEAVRGHGATLLPIDSEHNAIFQCLPSGMAGLERGGVEKILLTASGGPFRTFTPAQLADVTPDQACKHPNWSMGRKISVDSATLMNKGLEFIEACWLFDARPDQIEILVHPQSIIHSLVQYVDGSTLAQLGNPDMRTPIAHALAWPERIAAGVPRLDLTRHALDFQAPDEARFPCLRLARQAMSAGGTAPAVLNAANEVAVAAFLEGEIPFTAIPGVIDRVLTQLPMSQAANLDTILDADRAAREAARASLPLCRK
ncbi:1-deoxy-D-xylulose 5-phosphate reductoisomerase [Fluviicoccus keumensis]|uniref:1-deoxy-D-xylulose 5-phosphate reductoisomerase n=1 Tax=Fluviicoccus keumensis TaxID=1435465 RepID=A0A4Q7Z3N6_9GAMM|nr:1-deoxy-D-xylulose-5-phosphate reductoisomerase [Fluviicoccus keumensis]RZU44838.1 1-deoxy-D-xylulose 5-phosphate reductoisomerase [Fluviicoccus keumensis]